MSNSVDETFYAWLAGFVDGEGSIGLKSTAAWKRSYPFFVIAQHERARGVLEEIQRRCGGTISRSFSKSPYHQDRLTPMLRLDISASADVVELLPRLIPYLRVKREAAERVLAELSTRRITRRTTRWWTQEEDEVLRREYGRVTARQLADQLGRTEGAVFRRWGVLRRLDAT